MRCAEIKAFVPARDFALSKRFYEDIGFTIGWSSEDLAHVHCDGAAFLLQNFYVQEHADNFMMSMSVQDVDGWWDRLQKLDLPARYGTRFEALSDKPWGMRDFVVIDPTGVLWRISQDIPAAT